jgi:hypothetical protein
MFRSMLIAGVAACVAACANGWPHCGEHSRCAAGVHHSLADCTPTGSKISRQGCSTSTPAAQASGEDLDRLRQQSGGAAAVKLPGGH